MTTKKSDMAKSLDVLTKQVAGVVTALAESQRDNALKQHENAEKLEAIGELLDESAAEIKAELKKV